ncbi:MAG TPA: ribose ABC transporter permease [Bacteroidota bacterium]
MSISVPATPRVRRVVLRRLLGTRQLGTVIGLLGLSTVLTLASPYFLTVSNLLNVAQQSVIIAVIAAGMTFVIISAGIDLSVGSVLACAGLVMASALRAGASTGTGIALALGVGLAAGILNGLLVTFGRLPPFIATLGTMSIWRGLALMYTDGTPISGFSAGFRELANGTAFGIPVPVMIMLLVFAVSHFLLIRTKMGRYAYAMGGNEEGAILSGINVRFHKTALYAFCGMLSGLAAVLLTARLNSAQPIAGTAYELDAIAAAVIGGTSLMGGEGTLVGTLIGALIMGILRNGLNLLNVSSYLQQVAIGSVIIIAVFVDMMMKRRT